MIKPGVRLHGIVPQVFWAAEVVKKVWKENDYPYCITAGIEGQHTLHSDHYKGMAMDFRTWKDMTGEQLSDGVKRGLARALKAELGEEYFILMEETHLHISYRPLKVG